MKMATLTDLKKIPSGENKEPLIRWKGILVRQAVAQKLEKIQKKIPLVLVDGYRTPETQEKYFQEELKNRGSEENTHLFIAHPSVAGHPTGGAVDVTFEGLDLGGAIADFSFPERLPTFSTFVTPEQSRWRKMLHDLMVEEGFAPFYGEWWHFSYGDKEWAWFYGKKESLYSSLFVE